jgi:dihydropteroate synthase
MGVINITPNSFSDGGEIEASEQLHHRIKTFGIIDALDFGAESTAPMNRPISCQEEWERLAPFLSEIIKYNCAISIDTYHPETVEKISRIWIDQKIPLPFIWNDVSGKFDTYTRKFLLLNKKFHYVFCHNLSPSRELSGYHMNYQIHPHREEMDFLEELADYFRPHIHERVIFDPGLGFSKTYEQNWFIMDHFDLLQKKIGHWNWLIGFSRKSFIRKKFNITELTIQSKDELDHIHGELLHKMRLSLHGTVWVRTHRPELLNDFS